jgi:putative FmdB family regulatory protein
MPLYEYECEKCRHRFERIQKFSDPRADTCPECGGPVHKLASSPAIQFKGSGWYITDYAKKDSGAAGKSDRGDAPADGKAEAKTESSTETKAETPGGNDGRRDAKKAGKEGGRDERKTEKKAESKSDSSAKPSASSPSSTSSTSSKT